MSARGEPPELIELLRSTYRESGWRGFQRRQVEILVDRWNRGGQPWIAGMMIAGREEDHAKFDGRYSGQITEHKSEWVLVCAWDGRANPKRREAAWFQQKLRVIGLI